MLNMFRSGSKIIHASTHQLEATLLYFKTHLSLVNMFVTSDFHESQKDFNTLFNLADEGMSIFFIKVPLATSETYFIALSAFSVEKALLLLVNARVDFLESLSSGPRLIILRAYGDVEKVIKRVLLDFPGIISNPERALIESRHGTLIFFTTHSLSTPISFDQIYSKALFCNQNYHQILHDLRIYNLKYLNAGINHADWYELNIKIYDMFGAYPLHYNRLLFIFEKLELGLILGEAWGTDAATIFQAVGVYKIRFFTIHRPEAIKRIMIGLEFLEDGTRVVDYDLYYKRRKLHWGDLTDRTDRNKEKLGSKYRHEILAQLSQEDQKTLLEMEEEILKSRRF